VLPTFRYEGVGEELAVIAVFSDSEADRLGSSFTLVRHSEPLFPSRRRSARVLKCVDIQHAEVGGDAGFSTRWRCSPLDTGTVPIYHLIGLIGKVARHSGTHIQWRCSAGIQDAVEDMKGWGWVEMGGDGSVESLRMATEGVICMTND
jgi:hypothetical protein